MIGGGLFNQLIDALANHGRVSVVGRLAGPVPNFNTATLFFRRIRIGGVTVHGYSISEAKLAWEETLLLSIKKGFAPLVDSIFGFDALKRAFTRLAEGPMGKVLLRVR
jgi:NADPH2:quinone reductase